MSYKPKTLFSLLEEINVSLFLPHIQRPFVWEEDQIHRLFDSLMRGYPIQTLLFWRTKDQIKARKFMQEVIWEPDLSDFYDEPASRDGVDKTFVLDGQQRIQTLYSIFKGRIEDDLGIQQDAYFDVTSGIQSADAELAYTLKFSASPLPLPWLRVSTLLGKYQSKNAGEISDEFNDAIDVLNDSKSEDKETIESRRARSSRVRNNISQLLSILREERHFWVQTLDGVANSYPYRRVLDIFVRVNSGGTKLDASDLMFAAMKEGWDDIEEAIEETTELLNGSNLHFDKTFPLKCLLVAHGKGAETSPEKFSGSGGDELLVAMKTGWEKGEQAFQELRDFLANDLKIYADKVLRSYNSFVPLYDYFYFNPKPTERSRQLMRAYYYKAQMFGWYSQSTDTTINTLHSIVGKEFGKSDFPLFEIKEHFKSRNFDTDLKKGHLKETRLRFLLLNLIYVSQMGTSPFDVKYKGNDPHIDHIYPKHALKTKLGFGTPEINHLGNYRFVGATDNIRKRAELPGSYFTRLKKDGVDLRPHLLLEEFCKNPSSLVFDVPTYNRFRDGRFKQIWEIASSIVNVELS